MVMLRVLTIVVLALLTVACDDGGDEINVSPLLEGCDNGAVSVISFMQRSLDDIGSATPQELADYRERFDLGVHACCGRRRCTAPRPGSTRR